MDSGCVRGRRCPTRVCRWALFGAAKLPQPQNLLSLQMTPFGSGPPLLITPSARFVKVPLLEPATDESTQVSAARWLAAGLLGRENARVRRRVRLLTCRGGYAYFGVQLAPNAEKPLDLEPCQLGKGRLPRMDLELTSADVLDCTVASAEVLGQVVANPAVAEREPHNSPQQSSSAIQRPFQGCRRGQAVEGTAYAIRRNATIDRSRLAATSSNVNGFSSRNSAKARSSSQR